MTELDILGMNAEQLHRLRPMRIDRELTHDEVTHIFRIEQAFWMHSGDPTHPHAQLTSGRCSNGFVNTLRVLKRTNLCMILADQMVQRILQHNGTESFRPNDFVVGSDHAGATFSFAVASLLGMQHDFCEKKGEKPNERQDWNRFPIEPDQRVLQSEELVTTTKTLQLVRAGVRRGSPGVNIRFYPFVVTLVHRSKETLFEGDPILSVVHYDIQDWAPEECPLCKAGSEAIRPKGAENWARLTLAA